ncbi:thiamine pyrophosphate-binding protein [Blautia difficilis]|uniref:2-succinyl-5-enolpyruvyl-6-hydroxy-3-cyclohexene-1-carboxylate synthase n=1 Tax=Blautia difficilis TaxID=2763027 RepID=A0ABR7IM68_9FIRM|nr:thiamine pyrophosphate-binding protein [Blautia difficilis]MBC5781040.1 2-succinyl-5-enolpyruvyl-6-hydroxy-3-cyclohexene-1-carboxylate synthase [Blautia difficilis]
MYSSERNVQMLLSLLKVHKIKKMVLSPGSANASFVASAQYDGEFELYSSVDERSAAYIACGLAEESQEPVVICCTGATASRNYMPGLTEAYYRKLPLIAITATRPIAWLGQNRDQLIDRTVIPNDIAVKSVHLPVIENEQDEWECNLKINDALLELQRNGGGPVHINLTTSYSLDFSVSKLPEERVIQRVVWGSELPKLPNGNMAIFVGAHSAWNERLKATVESFCEQYNAFVFYDQTSNYTGKYGIPCGIFDIAGFPNLKIDLLIHLGNISASWPALAKEIWRVNSDGEIRDTYQHLTKVFEMQEEEFFKAYCEHHKTGQTTQYERWHAVYNSRIETLQSCNNDMAFSSLWIAQNMHKKMPKNSIIHFGILNSLRCWNCFGVDHSIRTYSNTGGFGIDGGVSSLIGASFVSSDKIYYGIFGDLAFFYDMNSLGNRHITSNVRILVANNGLGGEFKNSLGNVQKAGLGDSANEYISAYGHYGEKSPELLKHYAQDLGFQYLSAVDKQSFLTAMKEFTTTEHKEKPMLFEVFIDEHEDVSALDLIQSLSDFSESEQNVIEKTKKIAKSILGRNGVKMIQKVVRKND